MVARPELTHCCDAYHRLLFGVYALDTKQLLGTTVTAPIRVFVNNDVPSKKPSVPLCPVASQDSQSL